MGTTQTLSHKTTATAVYFNGRLYTKQIAVGRFLQTGYWNLPDRISFTKWTQVLAFRVDMWQNHTFVAPGYDDHHMITSRTENIADLDLPQGFLPADANPPF